MKHPLKVYMVGGLTVVNADGSQETVHGALLKGDVEHPEPIQGAGAMLYKEVELMAAGMSETIAGLASSRAFSEETAARLAHDLAAIEAVLDGDPDAPVEEGELAARVLDLRRERARLTARVALLTHQLEASEAERGRLMGIEPFPEQAELTIWVVVDSDGSLLAWSCPPEGPDDAMAQAVADIRAVDLEDDDLPAGWHEEQLAEIRAQGVVELELRASTVQGLAMACCALVGVAGHKEVADWTKRVRAALGGGS